MEEQVPRGVERNPVDSVSAPGPASGQRHPNQNGSPGPQQPPHVSHRLELIWNVLKRMVQHDEVELLLKIREPRVQDPETVGGLKRVREEWFDPGQIPEPLDVQ